MDNSIVDTLRDLGVPALVGAVVGAVINHLAAKTRGREEHERTVELLRIQDERQAARGILNEARSVRNLINSAAPDRISFGELHNRWSDNVLGPARLIRSDDLDERARAGAYSIFLATIVRDEHVSYAVLRGALDVEEWIEAWLRNDPPPPAHLPPMSEIQGLVRREGGRLSIDPLNELLTSRAAG